MLPTLGSYPFHGTSPRKFCAACSLHAMCLPAGLDSRSTGLLEQIMARHTTERGDSLFHMGDEFRSLYIVRAGHFKTFRIHPNGAEQVIGFHMAGDLVGLDGIATRRHQSAATALEYSEVCVIPFDRLQSLFKELPELQLQLDRAMSEEIIREQEVMLLLGSMHAGQRFAAFLLDLSVRYGARGYSPRRFQLRMSREDIGSHLDLTIESISRLLGTFRSRGWLKADRRDIEILDLASLEAVASGALAVKPLAGESPAVAGARMDV